jgi:hypothetical protein
MWAQNGCPIELKVMAQADLIGSKKVSVPVFLLWYRKTKGSLNRGTITSSRTLFQLCIIMVTIIISINRKPDTTQIVFRKEEE